VHLPTLETILTSSLYWYLVEKPQRMYITKFDMAYRTAMHSL